MDEPDTSWHGVAMKGCGADVCMSGCYGDYYLYVPGVRPPEYLDGISLLGFYIPPKVIFHRPEVTR